MTPELSVVVRLGPRLAELRAHPRTLAVGQMPAYVAGLVDLAALHQRPRAGDVAHGLPERLRAVQYVQLLLARAAGPRSTRSASSAVATVAFSVDPSRSDSGTFVPSVVIPSATTCVISASSIPSIITTASSSSDRSRPSNSSSAVRVLDTKARTRPTSTSTASRPHLLADRLIDPARTTGRDAGEHPLQHDLLEQIARGELLIAVQLDLRGVIRGPNPRPADRHPATAQRDLARRVTVALRGRAPDHACPSGRRSGRPPTPSSRATPPDQCSRRARAVRPSPAPRSRPATAEHAQAAPAVDLLGLDDLDNRVACSSRRFLLSLINFGTGSP